jgi:hypothetical protein
MQAVLDYFQSLDSFSVFSLLIGMLVSWYISKHFFLKKKPSLIQDAKRHKTTNFGSYRNVAKETESTTVNSEYFGSWAINANGTVTDNINKLTWIRAPWGTIWDGTDFVGNPIAIKWRDASDLFGKGIFIKNPFPVLRLTQRPTNFKENYIIGSCKVLFAGYDTWRLPTAAELDTLQFNISHELNYDLSKLYAKERSNLKSKLFPFLTAFTKQDILKYKLWTADMADVHSAWSHHGTTLDDTKIDELCYVLFVKDY